MGKISEIFNFDNIGSKIKNLAKWSCWITILLIWVAAPIAFIVLVSDDWTAELCWIPLVGAIIGPVFVWIGSWTMYAFGEFVEDVHVIRNKEGTTTKEKAKRDAALKAKCEAEDKANQEAEMRAKQEFEKAKRALEERACEKVETVELTPMDKPKNFSANEDWKETISKLSTAEIIERYNDVDEWNESYRYLCYLELQNRKVAHYTIKKPVYNSLFKLSPTGTGYICPVCNTLNSTFYICDKCGYAPPIALENKPIASNEDYEDYVDVTCPKCKENLSFLKGEEIAICPWCETPFKL